MILGLLALVAGQVTATVPDQSGRMVAPLAAMTNAPVVFFYIMPECPISAKYSPEIGRLVRDYPKVHFYLVNVDKKTTQSQAAAHKREFKIPCPELLDPKHQLVSVGKPTTVPTVVLFDVSHKVRYRGRIDDRFPALGVELAKPRRKDLRIAIDQLLAGKPITVASTPVIGCALPPG